MAKFSKKTGDVLPGTTHTLPASSQPGFLFDPLTAVLEGIHLRCMIPGVHEMTAPWGVTFGFKNAREMREHAESIGLAPMPFDPPRIRGTLLAIIRGSCWLEMPEHDVKINLVSGDLVILTRNTPHTMRDDPQSPAKHMKELIRREHIEQRLGLRDGGGGPMTTYINGAFSFQDEQDNPLLASLPPVIHVRGEQQREVPWLADTIRFLTHELSTPKPGAQSVINHLAHILFMQAVRAYFTTLPADAAGNWFAALQDPEIGPVLGLIHARPEDPWTVASLADQATMSRSAFAARFMTVVGQSPLKYLTECRMRKARDLLKDNRLGLKAISSKVGYATESAFSNAFKRYAGASPGAFRSSIKPRRAGEMANLQVSNPSQNPRAQTALPAVPSVA